MTILKVGVEKSDQIVRSLLTVARPTPSSWREVDVNQSPLFTKKSGGIGLGLALVRSLTEGHGGHVSLQSEVGKGSVFSVHLPTNAEQSQLSKSIW